MAFGLLNIEYQSEVLSYADERTPTEMCGVKMLPIVKFADGEVSNESLYIIRKLDENDRLGLNSIPGTAFDSSFEELLSSLGSPTHNLVMPYWMYTQEFGPESRDYFQEKKEKKRGPFHLLMDKRYQFEEELNSLLNKLEGELINFYQNDELTIKDIALAAHLWGLYILPEFQFSPKLHTYLQEVKKLCRFDYHRDFKQKNTLLTR
jgi:glutaredoxin 2